MHTSMTLKYDLVVQLFALGAQCVTLLYGLVLLLDVRAGTPSQATPVARDFFIDNLLVRIHGPRLRWHAVPGNPRTPSCFVCTIFLWCRGFCGRFTV